MARASQLALERAYYQEFAKHCPVAPKGTVEFSDKPDIRVFGEDQLGIEVTNIYLKDGKDRASEQVQSKLRADVIRQAEALYLSGGHPRYEFWFDFDPHVPICNSKELSKRVFKCVLEAIKEKQEFTSYKGFEECPELRFMTYNGIEYACAQWRPIQSYEVPALDCDRVFDIVATKASKVSSYQCCDRYWLLLIVEFWDPAQDQHITWNDTFRVGPTPFEKILIYKPATREWLEVPQ